MSQLPTHVGQVVQCSRYPQLLSHPVWVVLGGSEGQEGLPREFTYLGRKGGGREGGKEGGREGGREGWMDGKRERGEEEQKERRRERKRRGTGRGEGGREGWREEGSNEHSHAACRNKEMQLQIQTQG